MVVFCFCVCCFVVCGSVSFCWLVFGSASAAAAAVVVAATVVIAAAVVVATAVVAAAVIGEYKDQNDEQDPVVIVTKEHGVNLLSCLSLPYYAGKGKG